MTAIDYQPLRTEAIARMTWGESPDDVQTWLLDNGMSRRNAALLVRECVKQRAREMRARGAQNLLRGFIALALSMVCAIGAWLFIESIHAPGGPFVARGYGVLFAPSIFSGIYGGRELWLAFDRLIFGARADGAVSDIES